VVPASESQTTFAFFSEALEKKRGKILNWLNLNCNYFAFLSSYFPSNAELLTSTEVLFEKSYSWAGKWERSNFIVMQFKIFLEADGFKAEIELWILSFRDKSFKITLWMFYDLEEFQMRFNVWARGEYWMNKLLKMCVGILM
jgi:hypothetical protein